jgi:alkylation response protein AidB-like acyl-CoA dehydrogenase
VAGGLAADLLFVAAGDALWAVDADAPGVERAREDSVDGSCIAARIRFDGAPARRLGPLERLAPVLDRVLAAEAAFGLGCAEASLELATSYARERRQFGAAIGSFQAVAHLLVDMLHAVELGRGLVHHALWSLDAEPSGEAHRAALAAKAWASEHFASVAAGAIQVFGGTGFTWENDVHLYYKRLLALELSWGGAAACWDALAAELVAAPRPDAPDARGPCPI